jgi:c-di-GMP-binding flagellar brake protein YcgR
LDASGGPDPWAQFRVTHPQERNLLLRQLRDGQSPVNLNGPDGSVITTTLWALDDVQARLSFSADPGLPALARLVEADEAVAVAYMDSVKLQFDVNRLVLVRGPQSCSLQCTMPAAVYRFQRRNAFRVRTPDKHSPTARFRHPSIPDMPLALRVLDVSIGGCALWLPADLPPLQAGTQFAAVTIELDAETRFQTGLSLQHVTGPGRNDAGVRLGCEWQALSGNAERTLQRWIDHMQKRRRLLSLE